MNAPIETIILDLDETLYLPETGVLRAVDARINLFMTSRLRLAADEVDALRQSYYVEYGTTLRGLELNHSVDAVDYLEFVHDVDIDAMLEHDAALDAMLSSLDAAKVVFTNGSSHHAERVLRRLGIRHHMADVIGLDDLDFVPKPDLGSYRRLIDRTGMDPTRAVFVDDHERNLEPARAFGIRTVWVRGDDRPLPTGAQPSGHASIERIHQLASVLEMGSRPRPRPQPRSVAAPPSPRNAEPFGLYLHIPYCRVKCPYCDFNVVAGKSWPEERYTKSLVAELERWARAPEWAGRPLATIYFGGGTPSLFGARSIEQILNAATRSFPLVTGAEITVEANPEDLGREQLTELRSLGANRLSIGIQTFTPRLLGRLGRAHTAGDTKSAVARARSGGFDNVSLDLIFAIPGQSASDWASDLEQVIEQAPEHISAYSLTYEPGTPLTESKSRGRLIAVDEDLETRMFLEARRKLAANGYEPYEVSSYARPGFESRHNSSYWTGADYLGVGAGAHSHRATASGALRWWNVRDSEAYCSRALAQTSAVDAEEVLTSNQAAAEIAFLGLRTARGLSIEGFRQRFGAGPADLFPTMHDLAANDLVQQHSGHWRLTESGLLLADSIAEQLILTLDEVG